MRTGDDERSDRVLVLTPSGRDAELVAARLTEAGMGCEVCADLDALLASLAAAPAGALLIARRRSGPARASGCSRPSRGRSPGRSCRSCC